MISQLSRIAEEEEKRRNFAWPNGYKSAVAYVVDVDACAGAYLHNKTALGPLSAGDYGPRCGVPRLLDFFARHGIEATFFIPGWVAERYPEMVKEAHRQGHEIAAHSYLHEPLGNVSDEEEKEIWDKTNKILSDLIGEPIHAFRASGDSTAKGIKQASKLGWRHRVNTLQSYYPAPLTLEDGTETGIVQMTMSWIFDDFTCFWGGSRLRPPNVIFIPMSSGEDVLDYWKAEFDSIHEMGGLTSLGCHPRAMGRPSRMRVMEKLFQHIKATPDVWITSPRKVTNWVLDKKA